MLTVWSLLGRKETPFVYGQKAFLYPRNKALRICEIPLGHCHTPAAFETATLCQGPRARAGVWHHDAAMPISHSFPSEGQAGDTGSNLLRSVTLGRKKPCKSRAFSFAAIPAFAAFWGRSGRTDGVMPEAQNVSPSRIRRGGAAALQAYSPGAVEIFAKACYTTDRQGTASQGGRYVLL